MVDYRFPLVACRKARTPLAQPSACRAGPWRKSSKKQKPPLFDLREIKCSKPVSDRQA